jgi:hypothetical protein
MSRENKLELPNAHEQELNPRSPPEGSTPEAEVSPSVAHFPAEHEKKDVKKLRSKPECV